MPFPFPCLALPPYIHDYTFAACEMDRLGGDERKRFPWSPLQLLWQNAEFGGDCRALCSLDRRALWSLNRRARIISPDFSGIRNPSFVAIPTVSMILRYCYLVPYRSISRSILLFHQLLSLSSLVRNVLLSGWEANEVNEIEIAKKRGEVNDSWSIFISLLLDTVTRKNSCVLLWKISDFGENFCARGAKLFLDGKICCYLIWNSRNIFYKKVITIGY